ncbi:hypothetical protein CIB93_08815 [Streptomyces sp. WZ.A104]|uniref:DUF6415 family natural product biosynthesis protein n=1 Tax=Streptomyces sp. WZ.A104 TaxID=2023771 RepID=UPI000BBBDE3F|nr:DUF6415 family natural product biosynthesis protein [Streptomyces sp. WZ.A104]PCG86332.1 hypothetical protein CIB93_08815 [Streptomyces sp. WZ.A104]
MRLPERGFAVSPSAGAPDTESLRRFLEAMRRQHAEESAGKTVLITPEAISQTADYVLSHHLNVAQGGDLDATAQTLRGYLAALADEAEAHLDTGRIVVREMVGRARSEADEEHQPSLAGVRRAAKTARDLLALMTREGWRGAPDHGETVHAQAASAQADLP